MPGTACSRASTPPSSAGGTASFSSNSAGAIRWDTPTFTIVIAGTVQSRDSSRSGRDGAQPVTRDQLAKASGRRSEAGSRRRRGDRVDRRQRPAHPGHRSVRVITELTGHPHGTAADSQPLQRRRDGATDLVGEGDPEGCKVDTNSASGRTASNVPGISYPASDVFVARISAIVLASLPSNLRLSWGSPRILSSFAARSAYVFAASVQLDYRPAGIASLRLAAEDDSVGGRGRKTG